MVNKCRRAILSSFPSVAGVAPGAREANSYLDAKEILKIKGRLNDLLAYHSGQSLEQIEKDTDRDNFMSAVAAQAYGLIDTVLEKRP